MTKLASPTAVRSRRARRTRATALALTAALGIGASAAAPLGATVDEVRATTATGEAAAFAPVPDGYEMQHAWFDSYDGTQLHAGIFLPADRQPGERHPVIATITPYTSPNGGATGLGTSGVQVRFPELLDHDAFLAGRYAYVQVDARSFGGSEGCFGYYLEPEARDTEAAIEWLADQDWSSAKVGLWGKSYDAAQEVLALGRDAAADDAVGGAGGVDGLAAAVIQSPGLSAYTALWMNGVHYATGRYATTSVYTADDLFPPHNTSTLGEPGYTEATISAATVDPTCRTDAVAGMNTVADRDDPFWADKEPYRDAAGSSVPTFWTHGFFDANTKPVQGEVWETLAGPTQAWFGQFAHERAHLATVGRGDRFLDEAMRFMDEHVRGVAPTADDPAVTVEAGGLAGGWRSEAQWPPADTEPWTMALNPGSYVNEDGNAASRAGSGVWSVTPELPGAAHLAGEAVLDATIDAGPTGAQVVAHLYDLDTYGRASLINRGAMLLDPGVNEVSFALYPQDWVLPQGHRFGVRLSASDDSWFTPGVTRTDVEVVSASLELPLLRYVRDVDALAGGPSHMAAGGGSFNVTPEILATEVGTTPPPQEERP